MSYQLFQDYVEKKETETAILVGNNYMHHNPADRDHFLLYFGLLCELAEDVEDVAEKEVYYEYARDACSFFSDATEMNDSDVVESIVACQHKLVDIHKGIRKAYQKEEDKRKKSAKEENERLLDQACEQLLIINRCESKTELDVVSETLMEIEASLDHSVFDVDFQRRYNLLSEQLRKAADKKLKALEDEEIKQYNIEAVIQYYEILTEFEKNKKDWMEHIKEHEDEIAPLFQYDEEKLYTESAVYQSYVYNYIFNSLDNKERKCLLTKMAIENKKRGRT